MKDNMKKEAMKKSLMQLIDLMDEMESEDYSEKLGGLKKVTVAAPSEEGLKKGLSKAEQLLKMRSGMDMEDSEEESEDEEECEGCEEGCEHCEDKMPMMLKKRKMME
jgi:hypothetical protein